MATNESTRVLDELLGTLDRKLGLQQESPGRSDAIAEVLAEMPRQTAVVSLRDAPVVEQFRQALIDGLIRTDTANQLLKLVNEIVVRLVP